MSIISAWQWRFNTKEKTSSVSILFKLLATFFAQGEDCINNNVYV